MEVFEFGIFAYPLDDVAAGFFWHLEIGDDEAGERIFLAVFVDSMAGEVIDGFFAVSDDVKAVEKAGFFKCALGQEDVVFVVFSKQDGVVVHGKGPHARTGFGFCKPGVKKSFSQPFLACKFVAQARVILHLQNS